VTSRGPEPGLSLQRGGREVVLVDWGDELLDEFAPIAATLDARLGGMAYRDSLAAARACLADARSLPSARVLAAMADGFAGSHRKFVRSRSEATRRALLELPWSEADAAHYRALADASRDEQAALEASDRLPFETFRQNYLSPLQLQP
jgi:glutamate--cysteine ligase